MSFLQLPLELREKVYELLFFGDHEDPGLPYHQPHKFESRKLKWAAEALCGTASNQIHPNRMNTRIQPYYHLSILRTNHQIQTESENVFYGWSSFNLCMDSFVAHDYQTFEFLQTLPRRNRRRIRRVEARCFYENGQQDRYTKLRTIPLFEWKAFMTFLAQECPSLQSLKLWGFADGLEGQELSRGCHIGKQWVQAILQIRNLHFFDIHAIPRRHIKPDQSCAPDFVRELQAQLYQQRHKTPLIAPNTHEGLEKLASFPFMKLPLAIRNLVYRFTFLPANRRVHPYMKSWYDRTTQNAVPLFLTCRQIHCEAEDVLYGQAIFSSSKIKYDAPLKTFLESLPVRLAEKTHHLSFFEDGDDDD